MSEKNLSFGYDEGGCVTVGLDTQTAFWQPYRFVTGQNIQIIRGEALNERTAQFLIPIFVGQMRAKFNWGGNGATLGRMRRLDLLLPAADDGKPDWDYMSSFVEDIRAELLARYRKYAATRLAELERKEIPGLDEVQWSTFTIGDIFTVLPGKRLEKRNMIPGDYPFIGASDSNNGVTAFVGNKNESLDRNVLGINYNGSVCEAFYHSYECVFTDDVKRLHLKNREDNEAVLLFMGLMIRKQKSKYEYAYKFNEQRMRRQAIVLPVADDGVPDYAYMEQYVKNVMRGKYERYLAYLDGQGR